MQPTKVANVLDRVTLSRRRLRTISTNEVSMISLEISDIAVNGSIPYRQFHRFQMNPTEILDAYNEVSRPSRFYGRFRCFQRGFQMVPEKTEDLDGAILYGFYRCFS